MKAAAAVIALSLASTAVAGPHGSHALRHRLGRRAETVVVYVYELNGQIVSQEEVNQGVKNGTLTLTGGDVMPNPPTPATPNAPVETKSVKVKPSEATPSTEAVQKSVSSKAKAPEKGSSSPKGSSADKIGEDFPDGVYSCDEVPTAFGALSLDYLGLGGWSGIQDPKDRGSAGYNDIMTVTTDLCSGGKCCGEGMYCSYACPPGYQKLQWPDKQGATGQSVGGLQCRDGKLHKTSTRYNQLCGRGREEVKIYVKNELGGNVAICRTDYPGTESETVPVPVSPGEVQPLTAPDADDYYVWQGGATSAQYYANPEGVSHEKACQWGQPGSDVGNYAPMNFGVGYREGRAWISVFQNQPTTQTRQKYNVKISGDDMSGTCEYKASTGKYCNDNGCNDDGCTVSAATGSLTYTLF